jgi:hypothetical protein
MNEILGVKSDYLAVIDSNFPSLGEGPTRGTESPVHKVATGFSSHPRLDLKNSSYQTSTPLSIREDGAANERIDDVHHRFKEHTGLP